MGGKFFWPYEQNPNVKRRRISPNSCQSNRDSAFWLSLCSSCGGPASRPAEVTPLLHSPPLCFQGRVRATASIQRPSRQWKFWSIEVDRRSASTGRCTDATGIVNKINQVSRLCYIYETNMFWNVCGQWDAETQRSILDYLIFDILGEDELPLLS